MSETQPEPEEYVAGRADKDWLVAEFTRRMAARSPEEVEYDRWSVEEERLKVVRGMR